MSVPIERQASQWRGAGPPLGGRSGGDCLLHGLRVAPAPQVLPASAPWLGPFAWNSSSSLHGWHLLLLQVSVETSPLHTGLP